jgi:hypothetical protein
MVLSLLLLLLLLARRRLRVVVVSEIGVLVLVTTSTGKTVEVVVLLLVVTLLFLWLSLTTGRILFGWTTLLIVLRVGLVLLDSSPSCDGKAPSLRGGGGADVGGAVGAIVPSIVFVWLATPSSAILDFVVVVVVVVVAVTAETISCTVSGIAMVTLADDAIVVVVDDAVVGEPTEAAAAFVRTALALCFRISIVVGEAISCFCSICTRLTSTPAAVMSILSPHCSRNHSWRKSAISSSW